MLNIRPLRVTPPLVETSGVTEVTVNPALQIGSPRIDFTQTVGAANRKVVPPCSISVTGAGHEADKRESFGAVLSLSVLAKSLSTRFTGLVSVNPPGGVITRPSSLMVAVVQEAKSKAIIPKCFIVITPLNKQRYDFPVLICLHELKLNRVSPFS